MRDRQPSILRTQGGRKRETVVAVENALSIILSQYRQLELLEDPEIHVYAQMRSLSNRLKVFGTYVQFVVGRSQQPLIKGRIREWDVRIESRQIAAETGALFEKVYELFMSLVSPDTRNL